MTTRNIKARTDFRTIDFLVKRCGLQILISVTKNSKLTFLICCLCIALCRSQLVLMSANLYVRKKWLSSIHQATSEHKLREKYFINNKWICNKMMLLWFRTSTEVLKYCEICLFLKGKKHFVHCACLSCPICEQKRNI